MLKFFLFCILAVASVSCATEEPQPDCTSPLVTGPCRAAFKRYGFDTNLGECRQFTYGGCGGNKNNYNTLAECQDTCEYYCD